MERLQKKDTTDMSVERPKKRGILWTVKGGSGGSEGLYLGLNRRVFGWLIQVFGFERQGSSICVVVLLAG